MTGTVYDWSSTAGSNTTVEGTNIAEGCPAGNLNNGLRAVMAVLRNTFANTIYIGPNTNQNIAADTTTLYLRAASTIATQDSGATKTVTQTDITNSRFGIGIAPTVPLDVNGAVRLRSTVQIDGAATLTTPLATTSGGTGGSYANLAAIAAALGLITFTSNANGAAIGLKVGSTTYYLQFGTVNVSDDQYIGVTYPVAFGTSVLGAGATPIYSGAVGSTNVISSHVGSIGLSGMSVGHSEGGGSLSSQSYWYAFGY